MTGAPEVAGQGQPPYTGERGGLVWVALGVLLAGALAWNASRAAGEASRLEAELQRLTQRIETVERRNDRLRYALDQER